MTEKQERAWECLIEQSGEEVANLLINYHGLQLLDDDFYHYLIEEGYIDDDD